MLSNVPRAYHAGALTERQKDAKPISVIQATSYVYREKKIQESALLALLCRFSTEKESWARVDTLE